MIVTPHFIIRKGTHIVSRKILFLEIIALRTNELLKTIFVKRKWMLRRKVEMRSIIDLRESNAGSCKNSMTDWSRLKTRRFSD